MKESSPGDRGIPAIESIEIDEGKYQKIAEDLFEQNKDAILTHPDNTGSSEIDDVLRTLPNETLQHYWGHGVTRGDIVAQIAAAVSMLENNIFFGSTAPLRGSGYADAYTQGSFFAISHKDENLVLGARDRKPQRVQVSSSRKVGFRMTAGAFICNGILESLVEPLRNLYPSARILYARELKDYIEEQKQKI